MTRPLKLAIIAGEVSGDLLGGDLIAALKRQWPGEIILCGVGGEALQAQGLTSLFDYSELSIMGFSQVSQIDVACDALDLELTAQEIHSLEERYVPHPVIGHADETDRG